MVKMTNKYNFKGIKRLGSDAMLNVFAGWLSSIGLGWFVTNKLSYLVLSFFVQRFVNNLANSGLIILNVGYDSLFKVPGQERAFLEAFAAAQKEIASKDKLTPEDVKRIDDAVIDKFRKYAVHVK